MNRQQSGVMTLTRQAGASWLRLSLTLALTLTLTLTLPRVAADHDCQRIPVRENIIKQVTLRHNNQDLEVNCGNQVNIHKCEGQCLSKVIPSVLRHRGFKTECQCCKEGSRQIRTLQLTSCYYNGMLIPGLTTTTQVTDLSTCGCFNCTN